MSITNIVFRDGHIPETLAWNTVVLIPKGGGGYRGMVLVEVIWKVCTSIVKIYYKVPSSETTPYTASGGEG